MKNVLKMLVVLFALTFAVAHADTTFQKVKVVNVDLVAAPHSTVAADPILFNQTNGRSIFLGAKLCTFGKVHADRVEARLKVVNDVPSDAESGAHVLTENEAGSVIWEDAVSKGCGDLEQVRYPIALGDEASIKVVCENFTDVQKTCKVRALVYLEKVVAKQ